MLTAFINICTNDNKVDSEPNKIHLKKEIPTETIRVYLFHIKLIYFINKLDINQ